MKSKDPPEQTLLGKKSPSPLTTFVAACFLPLAACLVPSAAYSLPLTTKNRTCQTQNLEILTDQLLKDLPSYANRTIQRARRLSRKSDFYSYVLVAGHPEFAPLTLGPGVYAPNPPSDSQTVKQVFFTTLERQYTAGQAIELQQFHWVFLTKTVSGWRLATLFSRLGGYPIKKPPTPPRENSNGIIAQAINTWLRDCQATRRD